MPGSRHYRRVLENHPLSDSLWDRVIRLHAILRALSQQEISRLRELATLFVHEKVFEWPGLPELDEAVRVEIAALASLPILGLGFNWYDNWNTVVVVPAPFVERHVERMQGGVVAEWDEVDSGESWNDGPVVVSLREIIAARRDLGRNVVIHEAAHRIDMTDGDVNGRPALHRGMDPERWYATCRQAFGDLESRIERGRPPRIDPYAAENDGEFFAVVTEYFFERPTLLRTIYPEVYALFCAFYRQDPATRHEPFGGDTLIV